MAVDQFDVVDLMSVDKNSGHVVLIISDHLDWSNTAEHQKILERKFNAYLAFVESGEILQRFPETKERPVIFEVVFKYRPDKHGRIFLQRARQVIESAGFGLRHKLFAESWDN